MSNYLLDSLGYSFLKTHELHFWTKSSVVPKSFPIQLTTTGLNTFFPGLEAHYGPNLPVDIEYKLERAGDVKMKENDQTMSFDGDMSVKFWVNMANATKEVAVAITAEDFGANFTALINGMDLVANVTSAGLNNIVINSTTFGDLDLKKVAELLNDGIRLGIPFLNIYLETLKVTIPSQLFGLFKLSDLVVKYHNNYIEAGLTPTFVAPSLSFTPMPKWNPDTWGPNEIYEEVIDENDVVTSRFIGRLM